MYVPTEVGYEHFRISQQRLFRLWPSDFSHRVVMCIGTDVFDVVYLPRNSLIQIYHQIFGQCFIFIIKISDMFRPYILATGHLHGIIPRRWPVYTVQLVGGKFVYCRYWCFGRIFSNLQIEVECFSE